MNYFKTIWVVIALMSIPACEKDMANSQLKHDLTGAWELRKISSFGGTINYSDGNGNTLEFSNNGHYTQVFNTADTAYAIANTFRVQEADHCDINLIRQVTDNSTDNSHASINGDTLFINSGNCLADGASLVYLRK